MDRSLKDNSGFSLVEVLISGVILTILMLPLLHNLAAAARLNAKAAQVQSATLMGQNLLESINERDMSQLAAEFNYPADFTGSSLYFGGEPKEVVPDGAGEYRAVTDVNKSSLRTGSTEADGRVTYNYSFAARQNAPYYYILKNAKDGAYRYDVLITMDQTAYQTDSDTYNSYKVPSVNEPDSNSSILAVSSGEEQRAVNTLYGNYLSYFNNLEHPGIPVTREEIQHRLLKKITAAVYQSGGRVRGKVTFTYSIAPDASGNTIPGAGSVEYTLAEEELTQDKNSIYVFFDPSSCNEVYLTKDSSITGKYNVYIVRQDTGENIPSDTTIMGNTVPVGINLYSNIANLPVNTLIKREESGSRIYKVTVALYKAGENFRSSAYLTGFTTSKAQ